MHIRRVNIGKEPCQHDRRTVLVRCAEDCFCRWCVIRAIDRHGCSLGDHSAIAVIDCVGEGVGGGFADGQGFELAVRIIAEGAVGIVHDAAECAGCVDREAVHIGRVGIGKGGSHDNCRAVLVRCSEDCFHDRGIVFTSDAENGDCRRRCRKAAIAVIDRVGEGVGGCFARRQRVELAVRIVAERAIPVVGDTSQGAGGVDGKYVRIREVDIDEIGRENNCGACFIGAATDGFRGRSVIRAGNRDTHDLIDRVPVLVLNGDFVILGDCFAFSQILHRRIIEGITPIQRIDLRSAAIVAAMAVVPVMVTV